MDTKKTHREKARWELLKNVACCFEYIVEVKSHKTAVVWPHASHLIIIQDKQDVQGTTGKARTNSYVTFPYGILHINMLVLVDQQGITSALCELEDLLRVIRDGWWESSNSVVSVQLDDDFLEKHFVLP